MPTDLTVTRFPNGVTNCLDSDIFNSLKVNDRSKYHSVLDDFDPYVATNWTLTGAPAAAPGDGGLVSMAAGVIIAGIQPTFTFPLGKRVYFRARGQVDNALTSALAFGFEDVVAAGTLLIPAHGIFLRKPAGESTFYLVHRVANAETVSLAVGGISDNTPFSVTLCFDGSGNILAGMEHSVRASITPPALTASALRVTAGIITAGTMLLDQVFAAKER